MNLRNILVLLIFLGGIAHAETSLKSPWDNQQKSAPIQAMSLSRVASGGSCPATPDASADLKSETFYSRNNGRADTVDVEKLNAYKDLIAPYTSAANEIASMADNYLHTNKPFYAQCAASWLNNLAEDNALNGKLQGFQSYWTQTTMLSSYSLAWLKIRNEASVPIEQKQAISKWLNSMGTTNKNYFENRSSKHRDSNVVYWSGLAVMAAGVSSNDSALYNWGATKYKSAIDSIDEEGFLPAELRRGKKALYYHNHATYPLVIMAELAASNGDDLYSYKDHKISKLVNQLGKSLKDKSRIEALANAKQEKFNPYLGWLRPYLRHYPNQELAGLLNVYNRKGAVFIGGEAPQ